jgi:hypothetical protein
LLRLPKRDLRVTIHVLIVDGEIWMWKQFLSQVVVGIYVIQVVEFIKVVEAAWFMVKNMLLLVMGQEPSTV